MDQLHAGDHTDMEEKMDEKKPEQTEKTYNVVHSNDGNINIICD